MEIFEKIFYGTGFGRNRMSAARAGYLAVIWVLIPWWLVTVYYSTIVGLVFTAASLGLSDRLDADVSFRHPYFTWTGDVGLENLSIRPHDPTAENAIAMQVRRVHFDLPNLGVMLGLANGGRGGAGDQASALRIVDHMDHVGVRVEGLQFDDFGAMPGVLAQVGVASAAPLEAEGCVGDTAWTASELPRLGISNDGIDMSLTLQNAPDTHEVHVTGELVSPHSSRAEFAQYFQAPSMSAFIEAPKGSRVATYERVAIQDDGFIKARDAFCAKRDGVALEEFRERHLAAVRRLLEAQGMRPTEELEAVYRQYLLKGVLVLEARPNAHVRREDYHNYAIADQALMYNGTLAAGGKPVPVHFEETPARPIPGNFKGSTWDLVALEGRTPASAAAPTATAVATAAPAATPVLPTPAPAAPPPTAVAAAAPVAAAPAPRATQVAALPDPDLTRRTTADGRPLASSLPSNQQHRSGPQSLTVDQLAQHIGEYVQVTTLYGDRREGRIDSIKGRSLNLKVSVGVGYAVQNIEFAQIREIAGVN